MSALLLYRDGRLITQAPQSSREPARALPDLRMTRLSEAGIRAIFDEARAAGLLDGDTTFGSESVPIVALTTTFVVNTADRTTTVSVYALESSPDSDWMTQAGDTFRETHRTLRAFLDRMLTISGSTVGLPESGVINTDWLPAGSVIEADEPYPIERLRIVSEVAGASVGTLLWPLATPLAELGVPYKGDLFDGGRCFVVDDEELATLLPILASARLDDSWESGGQQYLIYPRPLLPGDAGCEMAAADISVGSPGWTGGSRIVFTSNHEWQLQLYSINIDGTELTRLTTNGMYEPLPSPTGEWIAFYSPGDGTVDLVVMRADGSSQTSVSDGSTADASPIWTPDDGPPVWSPDGALLAFHSSRYVGDGVFSVAIHVVNADGSNRRLVLEATGDPVTSVTWLPDGRITYQRKSTAGPQSFVLDVGGSGEVPAPEDVCALPGCSPDGTLIAYTAADGYDGLVVVSADGSESILVAPDVISPPIWSPNSAMLLFERDDNLYVALADGSKTTLLAAWSPDSRAAWSPDSRLIAFNSNMDGVWGLYVVASDGTGLRRLAPNLP